MTPPACASAAFLRLPTVFAPQFSPHRTPGATVPDDDAIRCDACPVLCYIKPGRLGACDRYGNRDGQLVRVDPHVVLDRALARGASVVPFLEREQEWDGNIVGAPKTFVTAIGAGTTYPDYKPAPFIISSVVHGVDMVTVVTEGIFSYCGVKVKIDTDRHLGPETNTVRAQGEPVGHVTTSEYGSQMLSLGGVRHLTGVLSEHQAGKLLGVRETGIKMKGRRSTPGHYFRVAEPGTAWGGTNIEVPLSILAPFNPKIAWPGLRLLMVSTTGEHYAYYELDDALLPREKDLPDSLRI